MPAAPAPTTMTSKRSAGPPMSGSEELANPVEPVLGARVVPRRVLAVDRLELAQQFLLPPRELDRRLDRDVTIEIAVHAAAHRLDALVAQAEHLPALRFRRNLDLGVAVERRDLDFAAKRRDRERNRHLAMQIAVLALEHRMRLQADHDVQVAGRPAVEPRLSFTRQPDAIVLVDALGNLHRQRLVFLDAPRAAASRTRLGNDLARTVALRARLLDREEPLRHSNLALPVARGASLGLSARFRAATVTRCAGLERRDANLGFRAARDFFQRQFEVVAQVRAAIDTAAASAPTTGLPAENFAENVAKGVGEAAEALLSGAPESTRARGAESGRRVDAGVAELIVSRSLARIGEDFVRFLGFLEFLFRGFVVRIAVRMMFHRQLAIGLLDVLVGSVAIDAQRGVVVALRHVFNSPMQQTAELRSASRFGEALLNSARYYVGGIRNIGHLPDAADPPTEYHFLSLTSVNSASTTFSSLFASPPAA